MAFDIIRFLGGVNAYNTGQPIRGPSGSRGPILDLFKTPKEIIDEWSISNQAPTPEERAQYQQGIEQLSGDRFGNPEIVVQNRPPTAGGSMVEQDLAPPALSNRDWLLEAQAAKESAPERKGMFGMKGTLRDVVGLLGDAFLVQGGGKAMYLPQRQLERKSDAIVGMTAGMDRTDPATAAYLNAIERAAYEDPAMAEEMLKGFETRQLNQAVKENQIAQRTEATQKTRLGNITAARAQLQRLLRNTPESRRAEVAAYYGPLLARQAGVSVDELGIRSGMTPEDYDAFARSDMNVYQTETLQDRDRQLEIAKQNADANTTRANRPSAGRAAPNPTSASMAAPLIDKVRRGGKLTAAEAETLDRLGYSVGKKKGGRREPPAIPPPPGFNFKPRN